jgi:2-polyprenyl-6-methoxyphenol hydroxylase-like FAD-dependent oxidoreductase
LELAPAFAERARQGQREERFTGTAELLTSFSKPYGPGWALVGDAGYYKDPVTAQGINDAFRDAELVTEAVEDGLSIQRLIKEALAEHARLRNEAAFPVYEFTCQLATLEPPPPETQRLFAALRDNQPDTDRFMGVLAGTTPIPGFYAPENLGRIISAQASTTGKRAGERSFRLLCKPLSPLSCRPQWGLISSSSACSWASRSGSSGWSARPDVGSTAVPS